MKHAYAAAALVLLALGLRAWAGANSIVAKDTYDFVAVGKAIGKEGWAAIERSQGAGSTTQHPMQPAVILGLHSLGLSWIPAAQIASVGLGSLAVLCMLGFFRRVLPRREAWLAAALAAVHYGLIRFACDGRSEGAYLFFVSGALWAAANAFGLSPPGEASPPASFGRGASWAALAGLFSAGAYWTRPEGLGIALVLCAWAVADRLQRREAGGPRRIALAAVLLGACLVAALPYVLAIGGITRKKQLIRVLTGGMAFLLNPAGAQAYAAAAGGDDEDKAIEISLLTFLDAMWHPVWPFLLLGLFLGIRRRVRMQAAPAEARTEELFWCVLAGYAAVTQLLSFSTRYLADRHTISMFPVGFALAARGLCAAADFLAARAPALRSGLVLPLAVCVFLPLRAIRPGRSGRSAERDAGRWIRESLGPDRRIASKSSRPVLYADGDLARLGQGGIEATIAQRPDAIILDEDDLQKKPRWPEQIRAAGYALGKAFETTGGRSQEARVIQVWVRR